MMVCSTFTGFAWMQQSTDCAFVYQKFIISGVGKRLSPFVSALPVIFFLYYFIFNNLLRAICPCVEGLPKSLLLLFS